MAFIVCLSFAIFFLFMGHSTLMHFFVEDMTGAPIRLRSLVWPPAARGRLVAFVAFAAALPFILLLPGLFLKAHWNWQEVSRGLPVFLIFAVLPLGCYGAYLARRIKRASGESQSPWQFHATRATNSELWWPVWMAALLTILSALQ